MASIDWPAGLRNAIQSAKRVDRPGGFREVSVASGPAFVEPFSDDTPTFFDITLRFTRAEAATFEAWLIQHRHNTLAPFFNFPIDIPNSTSPTQEVRFVDRPPQRIRQDNNIFTYQGRMLTRSILLEAVNTITVSGETIQSVVIGDAAECLLQFRSDGNVYQIINNVLSQIDSATDWIRPVSSAPGDYQIRLTVTSGLAPNSLGSDAVATWLPLTSNRNWGFRRASVGANEGVWLIEIREGTGPTLASGSYTMDAERVATPVLSVSGETIAANLVNNLTSVARAAVEFRSDGNVFQEINGSPTQIDVLTDWIRPIVHAPGLYEIRLSVTSGTAPDGANSAAVNTWIPLTADRIWELRRTLAGTETGSWLIEIREGSGPVLASGTYDMSATRTIPTVTLSGETIEAGVNINTDSIAAVEFRNDGTVFQDLNGVFTQIDSATDWVRPIPSSFGGYEIRLTVQSGVSPSILSSAPRDTWLPMTTTRRWVVSRTIPGSTVGTWTIEIRDASTTVVLASNTYTVRALQGITVTGGNISGNASGETAIASISVRSDGNIFGVSGSLSSPTTTQLSPATDWLRPVQFQSNFDARLTVVSGESPFVGVSPVNVWVALNNDQLWELRQSAVGTSTGTWLLEIRERLSNITIDSANYVMTAQRTS